MSKPQTMKTPRRTLPCPFCGAVPKVIKYPADNRDGDTTYVVRCVNQACGIGPMTRYKRSKKLALFSWDWRWTYRAVVAEMAGK